MRQRMAPDANCVKRIAREESISWRTWKVLLDVGMLCAGYGYQIEIQRLMSRIKGVIGSGRVERERMKSLCLVASGITRFEGEPKSPPSGAWGQPSLYRYQLSGSLLE